MTPIEEETTGKVIASITTSVDGYFTGPLFVLTHRTADQPAAESGFRFLADLDTALAEAAEVGGDRDVSVGGRRASLTGWTGPRSWDFGWRCRHVRGEDVD